MILTSFSVADAVRTFRIDLSLSRRTPRNESGGRKSGHSPLTKQRTGVIGGSGSTPPFPQWDFLFRPRGEPRGPAPFVAEPYAGGLPRPQLAALCDLLAAHTRTPDLCFVGVWEGYGWLADSEWSASPTLRLDERTFLVRRGPLGLALAVGYRGPNAPFGAEPPTILWPSDRAWFVASDPDLDSSYIGGSDALIESLLSHPDLEAWRATADDDVTIGSDVINAG